MYRKQDRSQNTRTTSSVGAEKALTRFGYFDSDLNILDLDPDPLLHLYQLLCRASTPDAVPCRAVIFLLYPLLDQVFGPRGDRSRIANEPASPTSLQPRGAPPPLDSHHSGTHLERPSHPVSEAQRASRFSLR